ncbi:alpha/beta hydrolase [Emcibacter sp.]|uniref:alpha/beta hydrolase n=1 Tax=Emcibacter sp. TaxID=1979954 RepID=UPI002AA8A2B3|nr:alpha/beta hydrolase-fold protein [Emcibacter sp.]
MQITKFIPVLFGMIFFSLPARAGETIIMGERLVLKSDILGEERPYLISLPQSYNDTTYAARRYPVLYVLDAEVHFLTTVGLLNHMSNPQNNTNMQIPEMIIVGVPNTTDRMRNLTPTRSLINHKGEETPAYSSSGGGEQFLEFLEKELIPEIDQKYRTRPVRAIAGHSLGGLTVLHSLLSREGLFHYYIAIDSSLWWNDQYLLKKVANFIPENPKTRARVFISTGDHSSLPLGRSPFVFMTAGNKFFAQSLQKNSSVNFVTSFRVIPEQDHNSLPLLGLYYGLLHAFEGYKVSPELLNDGEAEALTRHFKSFSATNRAEFLPPEALIDWMAKIGPEAYNYPAQKVWDLLQLNVKNYPNSEHARKRLEDFRKLPK